jgi:hypothetical protein
MKKNNAVCSRCENGFRMGYTGIVLEDNVTEVCDSCAGVQRDKNGYPWLPRERVHTYAPIETADDKSTWFKVKRADAFGKQGGENQ